MDAIAPLRQACRETRIARERALRALHDADAQLTDLQRRLARIPDFLLNTPEADALRAQIADAGNAVPALDADADAAEAAVAAADAAYAAAAAAEPPLWQADGDLPLLLLPVRLETTYRAGGEGARAAAELWIRAYPDDVHVDSHERELTGREREAGEAYWRAIWAAGPDTERQAVAWRELLAALGASRALWTLEQLRPAGSPPDTATPPGDPAPDPGPFPEVGSRDGTWTRAPHTKLLPDRLVFSGYRQNRLMWRVEGEPIRDVLNVSFAPPGSDPETPPDGDLPWDAGSRWLVDFGEAVAAGMGVKVPLNDPNLHYDLVTVTGVSTGNEASEDARRVQDLFTAHSYTTGLAVLPAGTPTNNTAESRSGWRSRPEPPDLAEVRAARDAYVAASEQPAARTARALAIDGREALAVAPDALVDRDEPLGTSVRSLIARLYAQSLDFRPLGAPQVGVDDLSFIVDHFSAFVRSQGPLPTLRVGRQPYGVLPTTALDLWRGEDVDPGLVGVIASTLSYFAENSHRAPRVGTGRDQDAVVVDLLSRRPSSRRVRRTHPDRVTEFTHPPPATIGLLDITSQPALRPPQPPPKTEIAAALVPTPEMLALVEQRPLARLAALRRRIADTLAAGGPQTPESAFEFFPPEIRVLRDALGQLMDTDSAGLMYPMTVPVLSASIYVTFLFGQNPNPTEPVAVALGRALEMTLTMVDDVVALEEQASTRLPDIERLLCESLDTISHRVDAWVTSIPTARLAKTRAERPAGLRTGAYGWLTDVAPAEPSHRTAGDGYIVAPSIHHATTAAVLRSGYLAHTDHRALAVNLTSARVRRALALLDGVRAGQPLPALLGYRFERGLHDADLDRFVEAFRGAYPLAPAVNPGADGGAGAEAAQSATAARNVVDGQALRLDRPRFDGPSPPIAAGDPALDTIRALIADLDDVVDAVGDLLLAESVHQLVGGNPLRAGLAADTVGRGDGLPDEFGLITTPRSGSSVTYTVGVVPPASGGGAGGWSDRPAIATLEPALERWCRARLGAAREWRFECPDAAHTVSLEDIGASALEVVLSATGGDPSPLVRRLLRRAGPGAALAEGERGAGRSAELAELAAGLRAVIASGRPLLASDLDPITDDPWAGVDLGDLAGRAGAWLATVQAAATDLAVARVRLDGVADAAGRAIDLEEIAAQLDILAGAGLVQAAGNGPPPAGDAEAEARFLATVDSVLSAIDRAELPEALPVRPEGEARTAASALAWYTAVSGIVRALIGDGMLLLVEARLPDGAARAALAPENHPSNAGDDAVADWMAELARLRPAVSALDDVLLGAEVVAGTAAPSFTVAQAPSARSCCVLAAEDTPDPDSLAGFVVDAWGETFPRAGRTAEQTASRLDTEVAALVDAGLTAVEGPPAPERVDEEVDALVHAGLAAVDAPTTPEEVAAVAFHAARPDARSPQGLLLAVPPDRARGWRMEDVHGVIEATLELAQVRTLDLIDLPELRGALPPDGPFLVSLHDLFPN